MIDCDAIMQYILTQGGNQLHTLVGDAVEYGQTAEGFKNDSPRVVYIPDDGDGYSAAPVHDRIYEIHCYGGSNRWSDANAVYRALHDRLHGMCMVQAGTLGIVMSMHEDQAGEPVTHPATKHKLIACRFFGKFKEIG